MLFRSSVAATVQSKVYGAVDPTLTYTVSGLQLTDTEAGVLTGALTRAAGEVVGPYAITQGGLAANANYTINFTGTTLTINPAALSVAATVQSKVYGAVDPVLTYTVSGLQLTDTEAGVLTGALTRAAGEGVGAYAITQGSLLANANYTISFTGNTLVVVASPPTILSLTVADPTHVVILWSAISNVTYRVQGRPDFNTEWVDLASDVRATNVTASAVDNTGGAGPRFYRLLVVP